MSTLLNSRVPFSIPILGYIILWFQHIGPRNPILLCLFISSSAVCKIRKTQDKCKISYGPVCGWYSNFWQIAQISKLEGLSGNLQRNRLYSKFYRGKNGNHQYNKLLLENLRNNFVCSNVKTSNCFILLSLLLGKSKY